MTMQFYLSSDYFPPREKNVTNWMSDVTKSDLDTCKQPNRNEKVEKICCCKSDVGCHKLHACVHKLRNILQHRVWVGGEGAKVASEPKKSDRVFTNDIHP